VAAEHEERDKMEVNMNTSNKATKVFNLLLRFDAVSRRCFFSTHNEQKTNNGLTLS